jgi:ABC-type lipoprotein release transport system permease subunit
VNAWVDTLRVIAQIALRNLFASRVKTLIVGGIIGFGAGLVVLGTSLLDSIDQAMSRSITGAIAGDIQVYSSESKEVLDVFGGFGPAGNDIAPIADFAKLQATLLAVPNVKSVVPMGIDSATVAAGNTVDQTLSKLRDSAASANTPGATPMRSADYLAQKEHVRQIVRVLHNDFENIKKIRSEGSDVAEDVAAVQEANSERFWAEFDRDPLGRLEFLENKIAPLASDSDMLFLRYIGTDPQQFRRAFDRMTIVQGQEIPAGKRGFLFSKYVYEEQIKLKTARILDKIKLARDNRHERIAKEPDLQRMVRESTSLTQEIVLQLDPDKTQLLRGKLQSLLRANTQDVPHLLAQFFAVDDNTFDERYRFYYAEIAPLLQLYKVRVGDTLTIKAYTRSGYVQSANLHVYGVFAFRGLEQSPQAGAMNMMDLVSFRELYGYLTSDREKELNELREQAGATDVSRENAERDLFGTAQVDTGDSTGGHANDRTPSGRASGAGTSAPQRDAATDALEQIAGSRSRGQAKTESFDPMQLQSGIVLNAAVFLNDPSQLDRTLQAINAAAKAQHLPYQALPWQKAVGITGQFTVLMRGVLYTAVIIIFVVALIIINNALLMATLERVREFGTLRAIGAQRRFIWAMIVLESVVTGVLFGAIGTLVGGLLVSWLHQRGLPAWNDIVTFFFSGPRLYPFLLPKNLALSLCVVLFVSIISSAYPAWIAMRVSPRQAMQSEE